MLSREVGPVMEVVLVIASMLLLASVAAAVALDRGPFSAPPARPGMAGSITTGPISAGQVGAGQPESPAAGRWVGHEASVRACNDLQAQLRSGRLSCAAYRRAMADVSASHDRRHPLLIPPEA
jgi:hypothetical protein